jgi:hypothetical protein
MATRSYVIALLSVSLSLGTAVGITAVAVEKDRRSQTDIVTAQVCPPGSCTIVAKTSTGGPPSQIHNVDAEVVAPTYGSVGGIAIASLEP